MGVWSCDRLEDIFTNFTEYGAATTPSQDEGVERDSRLQCDQLSIEGHKLGN
jgi:hypothetical protein